MISLVVSVVTAVPLPHRAELPHNALNPEVEELPQRALEPQSADEPQRALLPFTQTSEPHTAEEPHSADEPHNAEDPQSADCVLTTHTAPVAESNTAVGEAAAPTEAGATS